MAPPSKIIPRDALGLGLRLPYYEYLFEHWPALDYFEILSENFMGNAAAPAHHLSLVSERYPLVLHGVGLNLLSSDPLDEKYIDSLCRLADRVDAPFVTDHLCWTGYGGMQHHDLLPSPYVPELVELGASRAAYVQRRLGRPFGLENLSSYVTFRRSSMSEWDFYSSIVVESDCWFMLDINNVYVSSQNHGFSATEYLAAIDFTRVLQVHIAGHVAEPSGLLVDTHDHPVADEVWKLYQHAWQLGGPFPTLIEWDDKIPPLPYVLEELKKAKEIREAPSTILRRSA
jgi:uncharacterized protein